MCCTTTACTSHNISLFLCFSVSVSSENNRFNNTVLYDLQFIQICNGDHLLVASGDPGILIYKWSHFEDAISSILSSKPQCQYPSSAISIPKVTPITTFHPHPSPSAHYGESVEINCTSYNKSDNVLYGAAGDMFGCYQWDMPTEKLLGTFGGSCRFDRGIGHTDYLHVVKSIADNASLPGSQCVITGGEDGNMGWWDGKSRKLIEMVNMQKVIDKNRDIFSPNPAPNSRSYWNIGTNSLWVSSMNTNSNWLAVCGGSECSNNSITSRAPTGSTSSGFVALWHLPTRTCTSGCITRENLNSVVYNQSLDCFVTGGNEGRISFWEPTTMVRSSRSWSTPPATYSISAESNMMVVGGASGKLDLFVDRIRVLELQFRS